MEVTTAAETAYKPRALDAKTIAEAFQLTAEDRPDQPAIRTKGDDYSITWGEYAQQVEKIARGLAGVGIGRGDTVAIMLTNRPEFHPVDSAAMHLGATPFSIYNTYTPDQIKFLVNDAATRVVVTEQASPRHRAEGEGGRRAARARRRDRRRRAGRRDDARRADREGRRRLRLRGRVEGRRARRHPHADLHVGHDRRPEGRAAHAQEPADRRQGLPRDHRLPGGGQRRLVAADGAHRRARVLALHPDPARVHDHLVPGPAPGGRIPAGGAADVVLRRAAHLGEAQGRDRGRDRGRAGRAEEGRHEAGARGRPQAGRADPVRPGGPRGARAAVAEVRRARVLEGARRARARPRRVAQRRRGADAARGDRVLPRDRAAARRAVGDVGDDRLRHLQPARQHQDRDGRPAVARRRDQARRGRRDPRSRARSSCRATATTRRRPARRSTRTAGCTPATSASSTTTASSRSSTARRSSSSTPPARTCRRRTSRPS